MVIVDPRFGNQTWLGNPQKFQSWENQRSKWGFVQQDMLTPEGKYGWLMLVIFPIKSPLNHHEILLPG